MWSLLLKTHHRNLDSVQKWPAKIIKNPVLTSLEHYRDYVDLTLFYRYFNKKCSTQIAPLISSKKTSITTKYWLQIYSNGWRKSKHQERHLIKNISFTGHQSSGINYRWPCFQYLQQFESGTHRFCLRPAISVTGILWQRTTLSAKGNIRKRYNTKQRLADHSVDNVNR